LNPKRKENYANPAINSVFGQNRLGDRVNPNVQEASRSLAQNANTSQQGEKPKAVQAHKS